MEVIKEGIALHLLTVLPAHSSDKSLAGKFAYFFSKKISKIRDAFSPTKMCVFYPIPTFLLKDCLDILLSSNTKLINYSLTKGSFPDAFNKAVVTPYKEGFPSQK